MVLGIVISLWLVGASTAVEVPYLSRPVINNVMGAYLNHPGLSFEPNPEGPSTLIRFNKARPSTYQSFVDALTRVTEEYSNENQITGMDCASYNEYRPRDDWDKVCRFDLMELGPNCVKQQSFGYEDGQPCVLFNLERVYRWLPVPYDNSSVPNNIRALWSQYDITLKCEGADASSRDNMGDVTYYPANGFAFKYYPNLGQPDWKPPLVFARFENPMPAILLMVECRVYARNIQHNRILDTGMVAFELLVD